MRQQVYDILKGRFLTDETSVKNWRFIFFVVILLLIMITSAHRADQKVLLIGELSEKRRELKAEFADTNRELMTLKLESTIRKQVKSKGLSPLKTPPQKIRVTYNKD